MKEKSPTSPGLFLIYKVGYYTIMNMVINKKMRNIVGAALSIGGLTAFLLLTKPSESNLGLSFAPLLFLWASIYFIGGVLADFVLKQVRRSVVQVLRVVVASSVTLLVMFSALGGVSVLDTIVLVMLAGLGSFYFSRM